MSRVDAGSATQGRLYWLDGARAALMLLGIPFHAAMVYSIQGWELSSPDKSPLLTALAQASGSFRMPAFFLVAGFFAAMLLGKRPRLEFVRARLFRLGVPLITCLLVLSPLQVGLLEIASTASGGTWAHSFFNAEGRVRADAGRVWVAQLWFLIDLMLYTLVLAAVATPRVMAGLAALARRGLRLTWLGLAALLGLHGAYSFALGAFDNLTGLHLPGPLWAAISTQKLLFNLPFFLAGALCCLERGLLASLVTWRRGTVALAALVLLACALWPPHGAAWQKALRLLLLPAGAWAGAHLVLGACARWLDRPSALVRQLVDSSYSIYLFHIIPIFGAGLAFCWVGLPAWVEFIAIVTISLTVAWSVHGLLKRYALYRLLFNGDASAVLKAPTPASEPSRGGSPASSSLR
ncbi:acyltransferase family protein [Caldimonas brevitalea]|uniref:Glucans biosynthesis protein C n=1 Tax=Caldimonas brevitalea TaxID=413882 RepID=A0A0G3BNP6_9BURK|nr:acyltransferase family protein [Caldimonas brevitalea]AKJ29613.1 glucans biosynthesis protein C [Caldimonas brevitalea]